MENSRFSLPKQKKVVLPSFSLGDLMLKTPMSQEIKTTDVSPVDIVKDKVIIPYVSKRAVQGAFSMLSRLYIFYLENSSDKRKKTKFATTMNKIVKRLRVSSAVLGLSQEQCDLLLRIDELIPDVVVDVSFFKSKIDTV